MSYAIQFFLQEVPTIFGLSFEQFFQVLSYVGTTIVGGVIYKFVKMWLDYNQSDKNLNQQASERLINNLEERIKAISSRVQELEAKREESYLREMNLTKMLAKSETKVEELERKIQSLERNQKTLELTVEKYYKKYGPLETINEAS